MQIGRIFGIPLRVDWSWLIVFALLVWTLSANLGPLRAIPAHWRVWVACLTVLAFFAGVIAHELAHALVGRRFGAKTRDVTLFVFGGVSRMDRVGATALSEAMIALAGPLLSFLLALGFALAAGWLPTRSAAFQVFAYLAIINALVGAFNMLPAYPLDGGRIFHAIAWGIARDRPQATKIAIAMSTLVGGLMACAGAILLLTGFAVSGVWTILIAWFILRSGQTELISEVEIEPLKLLRCGDLADPPGPFVQPDTVCDQVLGVMVAGRRRVLAVGVDHRFLGLLSLADFSKLAGRDASRTYVSAIMTPAAQTVAVTPDTNAFDALKRLSDSGFHQLPVLTQSQELIGFLTGETIRHAVAFSLERERLGIASASPTTNSRKI